MNGSLLGQCSREGGVYLCLIKGLQGTVSSSAWKDKQVEYVPACTCGCGICVFCCPVGSSKHSLTAQLCQSICNSQIPLPVSLYADCATSEGLR